MFLATKVEERMRKLRDVAIVCTKVASKNPNMVVDEQSKDFWRWSEILIYNEELLLEALCFDVTFNFYDGLLELEQTYEPDAILTKKIRSTLIDWSRTPICLIFSWPEVVLAAFHYCLSSIDAGNSPLDGTIKKSKEWNTFLSSNNHKDICKDIISRVACYYDIIRPLVPHAYDFQAWKRSSDKRSMSTDQVPEPKRPKTD